MKMKTGASSSEFGRLQMRTWQLSKARSNGPHNSQQPSHLPARPVTVPASVSTNRGQNSIEETSEHKEFAYLYVDSVGRRQVSFRSFDWDDERSGGLFETHIIPDQGDVDALEEAVRLLGEENEEGNDLA